MSGYRLHPEAYTDIDEIWEYIAQDNLDAADRVREEVFATTRMLPAFPQRGGRLPNLTSRNVRFTNVRDFVIAYAPDERPLLILGVVNGRRNPTDHCGNSAKPGVVSSQI